MMEGSGAGSVLVTNGSGRLKSIRILQIRIPSSSNIYLGRLGAAGGAVHVRLSGQITVVCMPRRLGVSVAVFNKFAFLV